MSTSWTESEQIGAQTMMSTQSTLWPSIPRVPLMERLSEEVVWSDLLGGERGCPCLRQVVSWRADCDSDSDLGDRELEAQHGLPHHWSEMITTEAG